MINTVKYLLFCIFLLNLESGSAQQKLSAKECIYIALENSAQLKVQDALNQNSSYRHSQALANLAPSINSGISVSSTYGRSIDPETNTYTNSSTFSNSYSLNSSLTVFDGFRLINNVKIAKISRLSGIHEMQLKEDQVSLNVIQAIHNVVYAAQMAILAQEQLAEGELILKKAAKKEQLGLLSQSDLLVAEASVAASEHNMHVRANQLQKELHRLKELMFIDYKQEIELDIQRIIHGDSLTAISNLIPVTENEDSVIISAINTLPILKISGLSIQSHRLTLNSSRWSLLPSLRLIGGYSTGYLKNNLSGNNTAPFVEQIKNRQGQYLSLEMSIPLFNSMTTHNNNKILRNQLKIAQYQLEEETMLVVSQVKNAVREMNDAVTEYRLAFKRCLAQMSAHQANLKKYDAGFIDLLDVQTSSNMLTESKAQLASAFLKYTLTRSVVEYYKGTRFKDQNLLI